MKLTARMVVAVGAVGFAAISAAVLTACGSADGAQDSVALGAETRAKPLYLDLTHEIPTFAPLASDPAKPDLTKPHAHSQPVPSFFRQVALEPSENHFDDGHFYRSYMTIAEHHGTHIDAPAHYVNVPGTVEADASLPRRFQNQLTLADLTGPIVYIDISQRVQRELDKNGGTPSPHKGVMDFSEASSNNVTAKDIEAVADKLQNGAWLVVNTGWSRFYKGGDLSTSPYINGWNFPGVSKVAVDALIDLEKKKGIRINGIAIDNIGIDSGEGQASADASFTGHIYASHVRGLQRDWKFIENATNLGSIASAKADSCTLVAGALPLVMGSGSPARVIAICEK